MSTDTNHPAPDSSKVCLDANLFMEVVEGGTVEQRKNLAAQLADFLGDPATSEAERALVAPVVLRLAVDAVPDVRKTLADRLVQLASLHADILFTLISDEDSIALPFLAATQALNHWQMMAILQVGDENRQAVLAGRHDIAPEAVEVVVTASSLEAAIALLDNQAVRLQDHHYHILYSRFGQVSVVTERMMEIPALPLDIRIMQTMRVSNRMHQLMAERGWVPANDAADLVEDAQEAAILEILIGASAAELNHVIPFMVSKRMLTSSILVRAACLGEMAVVERSLAHLSCLPAQRVRDLMKQEGLLGYRSLHKKAGLPQSCYGILQAACDVAADTEEEGAVLPSEQFGRRLIEVLMTRYEAMPPPERANHMEIIGRYAEDRVRTIAKRLKADIVRAA